MRRFVLGTVLGVWALGLVPAAPAPANEPAIASYARATPPAATPPAARRDAPRPRDRRATKDFLVSAQRAVLVGVGVLVFVWGLWRPAARGSIERRVRLALLLLLACLAYASYYQFFRLVHVDRFATTDNFHYYVGSKYFEELGYYGLYECSLVALVESDFRLPGGVHGQARDLRSMQLRPLGEVLESGRGCRERFDDARWQEFRDDVYYFVHRWSPHVFQANWRDHGYHTTPVWTLVGGTIAERIQLGGADSGYVASRLDRIMVLFGIGLVAWAFGLETACLVTLVWGTGFLWRYIWVGDAFLRHLWWLTAIAGVCLLRRGGFAAGGASLAASALLRIFPASLSLGYLLHAGRVAWRDKEVGEGTRRFLIGAAVTSVVLVAASLVTSPNGIATASEFARKISEFNAVAATNRVGLGVLADWLFPETPWAATLARLAVLAPFLVLFWRGLRLAEPWEAAALGICVVPMLTEPTNYYYSMMTVCALLAARRPVIGLIVLLAGLAWCLNGLAFYRTYQEFRWASVIAVLTCMAITGAMAGLTGPFQGAVIGRSGDARRERARVA